MLRNATFWIRACLGVYLLWCVTFLVGAEKPWSLAVDQTGWQDDVVRGLFFGTAAGGVAAVVLLLTSGVWARALGAPSPPAGGGTGGAAGGGQSTKWFWAIVLGAVVLGGALRWNLAHGSLWWDELWQVKRASHGFFKPEKGGENPVEKVFRGSSWKRCAWYYQKPTNHVPAALASRASIGLWQALTDAPEHDFNDFSVRMPTFVIALVSIAVVAGLLRSWGLGTAGVFAAFLLALHPWHIRYGVDARAYSYLVLLMASGCFALTQVATRGRWRGWAALGLVQFFTVWSLPNAFWYAGGFFVAGAVLVPLCWNNREDRVTAFARLVAVNSFAALLFFQVAGPNVAQALRWIGKIKETTLTWRGLGDALSHLVFGLPARLTGGGPVEVAGLPALAGQGALPAVLLGLALVTVVAVGARELSRRKPVALVALLAVVGSASVYLLATVLRGDLFYPRYLIYLLVPFVVLAAVGMARWPVAGGVVLMGFTLFTSGQRKVLTSRPYAPLRDVAIAVADPDRNTIAAGYYLGGQIVETYNPSIRSLADDPETAREQIESLIREAQDTGARLLVFYGYPSFNRALAPGGFELLDDPASFRETAAFQGIEPDFYFRVLEFVGGKG